jgi:AbrB family looped-hinge helix DNA binding protein
MLYSTVTKKGQTTLPSKVRKALDAKPGDRLAYEIELGHVTIHVHPGTRALMGSLASSKGKGRSFKSIREAATKEAVNRFRK